MIIIEGYWFFVKQKVEVKDAKQIDELRKILAVINGCDIKDIKIKFKEENK